MENMRISELQVIHLDFLLDDKISNKIVFFFFPSLCHTEPLSKVIFFLNLRHFSVLEQSPRDS